MKSQVYRELDLCEPKGSQRGISFSPLSCPWEKNGGWNCGSSKNLVALWFTDSQVSKKMELWFHRTHRSTKRVSCESQDSQVKNQKRPVNHRIHRSKMRRDPWITGKLTCESCESQIFSKFHLWSLWFHSPLYICSCEFCESQLSEKLTCESCDLQVRSVLELWGPWKKGGMGRCCALLTVSCFIWIHTSKFNNKIFSLQPWSLIDTAG